MSTPHAAGTNNTNNMVGKVCQCHLVRCTMHVDPKEKSGLGRAGSMTESRRPRTKEELKRCSTQELDRLKSGETMENRIERRNTMPHDKRYGKLSCQSMLGYLSKSGSDNLENLMEEAKHCRYLRCGSDKAMDKTE